jgi:hypothetical protein
MIKVMFEKCQYCAIDTVKEKYGMDWGTLDYRDELSKAPDVMCVVTWDGNKQLSVCLDHLGLMVKPGRVE